MIKVEIIKTHSETTALDDRVVFSYQKFVVEGHANNGTKKECIKVCAGISACINGIFALIQFKDYDVDYDKGMFSLVKKEPSNTGLTSTDVSLTILEHQLENIYKVFPSQFVYFKKEIM